MGEVWSGLQGLDTWGFLLINRVLQNPAFDLLMPVLSGKRYALLPAAAVILALGVRGGRRVWILLAAGVAAVALSDLGANLIKAAVQRPRPCHVIPEVHLLSGCTRSFAFPSNHASNMFAIAAVGWVGFPRWRWGFVALAAAVAYSRVYLGVHYPLDVLGWALWGSAVGWTGVACLVRLWPGSLQTAGTAARTPPADIRPGTSRPS